MNWTQQVTGKTQCAGQDCPEREGCVRWRHSSSRAPWASFDVERRQCAGPCVHRIEIVRRRESA